MVEWGNSPHSASASNRQGSTHNGLSMQDSSGSIWHADFCKHKRERYFWIQDVCGHRKAGVQGGTESSNLLCSSGESTANLTPETIVWPHGSRSSGMITPVVFSFQCGK
jgi:hypothetical protein